ncbi:MAG: hypothetical protein H6627_10795 [Calditrichae bacterium]|nr:hypothetical protein [Calditrichia bacterium]
MATSKNELKLPPQTDDHIIEINLKHVLVGFSVVLLSTAAIAGAAVLLRNHLTTRRHKLFIKAIQDLITTIQKEKGS